jgi:hypothetical protein
MGSAPGTGGGTGLENMTGLDHCLSDIMRNDGAMQNHYRGEYYIHSSVRFLLIHFDYSSSRCLRAFVDVSFVLVPFLSLISLAFFFYS